MPSFTVNEEKIITLDSDHTMLNLKKMIIDTFELDCGYVDLDFKLDKPIRSFGKMNLEPGILPRTMDNFPFDRYGISEKVIKCNFIPVNDYLPNVKPKNNNPQSIYQPPNMKKKEDKKDIPFNIYCDIEFPSLK